MNVEIPSLGDVEEVEVIELCVAVGDHVAVDDALIVIESDKASMEVPSTSAGVVESIEVEIGDQVSEGTVIVKLAGADAQGDAASTQSDSDGAQVNDAATAPAQEKESEQSAEAASGVQPQATELEVLVPDIGDAEGVVVIEIAIKAGDTVAKEDLLVVLESDKASMELAAEYDGRVLSVAVKEGDEVAEGSLIATLSVDSPAAAVPKQADEREPAEVIPPAAAPETPERSQPTVAKTPAESGTGKPVYAGPAVRRLARELGVDLSRVNGTGARKRITKDDVKAFVKETLDNPQTTAGGGLPQVNVVDFTKFGEVELIDLTRIQRVGADNLHKSWVNLPHVTQHDEVDVTELEKFRASLKAEAERKGTKITPLAFIIKACCHALAEFPRFNSSLHENREQLYVKQYVNIGMAVDTPDGLVVPVIKDADKKNIWTLCDEIADLAERARNKKLSLDDLQGGTFSVSSLGPLGGTGFTPIVNAPEVAILGVANMQTKPLWNGEAFEPRKVLPLSLSYDHRVINGADGGRFMVFLTRALADIRRLSL